MSSSAIWYYFLKRGVDSFCCDDSHNGNGQSREKISATGPEVYATRFRRAKRLQLERQVVFEMMHGGRIHEQVGSRLSELISLGNENDQRCSWERIRVRGRKACGGSLEESDDGGGQTNQLGVKRCKIEA